MLECNSNQPRNSSLLIMPRPILARIDMNALRHNHGVARRHAGEVRLWSVIKANAYGHGVIDAANALRHLADGFALIELESALTLRDLGIQQPILILEGFYQAADLTLFAEYHLTPVIHSEWQIDELIAARLPVSIPIYLKIESGMNRLGIPAARLAATMQKLEVSGAASAVTLMTHFADADEPHGIGAQLAQFGQIIDGMSLPVSIANSATLLRFAEALSVGVAPAAANWARPGIMLYGASPFPALQSAAELELKPAMTLSSELISVRDLQPGDRVGYGGHFVAETSMRIGVVACGYGDGYPRHAPTGTPVLVAGQRTRTLGRVSMDKICVDLSDFEKLPGGTHSAGVGATVILWGGDETSGVLPADEVATAADTIAYELFCGLAARVPREVIA